MKEIKQSISLSRLRELINEALTSRGVYNNQLQKYVIDEKEYFVKKGQNKELKVETYKIYNKEGKLLKEAKGNYLDIKRYIKEKL